MTLRTIRDETDLAFKGNGLAATSQHGRQGVAILIRTDMQVSLDLM